MYRGESCIISFLYIKPQLTRCLRIFLCVVLYRFSTSNHNLPSIGACIRLLYYIVSLHQTTTIITQRSPRPLLYYIVSLHQTTTTITISEKYIALYYIVSLHQTTTWIGSKKLYFGCIISFLYIKPQRSRLFSVFFRVVLYRFSTSNHNLYTFIMFVFLLYYIVSLHQTTTMILFTIFANSCIISFLYIKPQLPFVI